MDDPCVVQLAVDPQAWTSRPPQIAPSILSSRLGHILDRETSRSPNPIISRVGDHNNIFLPASYPISPYFNSRYATIFYIDFLHTLAIESLTSASTSAYSRLSTSVLQEAKSLAKTILASYGHVWPSIFDEQFPSESQGGVKYDLVYQE